LLTKTATRTKCNDHISDLKTSKSGSAANSWQSCLHKLAEALEARKYFRYAEQLRGAALSAPNNIAEDSASTPAAEFRQFLNLARRSPFENTSMLLVFEAMGLCKSGEIDSLLCQCEVWSRMMTNFARTLK
jgi:four helix bundle protein